jgi:hypothetical protein
MLSPKDKDPFHEAFLINDIAETVVAAWQERSGDIQGIPVVCSVKAKHLAPVRALDIPFALRCAGYCVAAHCVE